MRSQGTFKHGSPGFDSRVRFLVRSGPFLWLLALLIVSLPRLALAHLAVPMCSGNAESIAAPPPESPPSGDELREVPTCPASELPSWERRQPGPPTAPHTVLESLELGALFVSEPPLLWVELRPLVSQRLDAVHFRELPRELFRPPEG